MVWESVTRQDRGRVCDVADMSDLLQAPLEDVWPFVQWAAHTAREVISGGGKDIWAPWTCVLKPRLLGGPYRVVVEGNAGAGGTVGAAPAPSETPQAS